MSGGDSSAYVAITKLPTDVVNVDLLAAQCGWVGRLQSYVRHGQAGRSSENDQPALARLALKPFPEAAKRVIRNYESPATTS